MASTLASHTTSASLRTSDGCMVNEPMPIQFRLPFRSMPSGVNTSSWRTTAAASAGQAITL